MSDDLEPRVLLLVEDNPADAELVSEMLRSDGKLGAYKVHHVTTLSAAEEVLVAQTVDIVLLDLRLPDASGTKGVTAILDIAPDMPVVVLTGLNDEAMALHCIDAGAQDYLGKDDLRPTLLRRTIGYAITRLREAHLRELQSMLTNYRALSSAGRQTNTTAVLMGVGSIKDQHPEIYTALVRDYQHLVGSYIQQTGTKTDRPGELMSHLATRIGDLGGGPRDLLDIHVAALEGVVLGMTTEKTRHFIVEGRLLAVEMMGLLVDYFRVGQRRGFSGTGR